MELHPVSYYVHELKPRIPAVVFQPAPSRLVSRELEALRDRRGIVTPVLSARRADEGAPVQRAP